MKIDQTTLLILAGAGVLGWFLFRKPAQAAPTWGETYVDTRGREVVEGYDETGAAKSFIVIEPMEPPTKGTT